MLTINGQRLLEDLDTLGEIGETPQGGVSRPAMSETDVEARGWFRQRCATAGLEVRQDGAANLSAILPTTKADAQTLLIGSHLDTVPNGGRFDGALGVIAALEVARTIQESQIDLPFHLEVISFTDEEGSIFGLLGSRALTGQITLEDLKHPRCDTQTMTDGMLRLGITSDSILSAGRDTESFIAFIEVHIEQGTRLEESNIDVGVVTSIVGIRSFWLTFLGQAAHAGTMPMKRRADALWGASSFIQQVKMLVMETYTPGVVNIGYVDVEPGAFNIVPARVKLSLEFRHGTEIQLDEMQKEILALADRTAAENQLSLLAEPTTQVIASSMNEHIVQAIVYAAQELQLTHKHLISFAAHDTQAISKITPAAMFFVPSVGGLSHHPQELTHSQDCVNAGNVLLRTVLNVAAHNPK